MGRVRRLLGAHGWRLGGGGFLPRHALVRPRQREDTIFAEIANRSS